MGQDTLLHGETLLIIPATDSDHITLPFFTQRVSSNFCGYTLLAESTKFLFIVHFNELLAASGRERDVQLHSEAADSLRGATKKSPTSISTLIQSPTFLLPKPGQLTGSRLL